MRPKIAVFDFASCEGCELQIANLEEDILELIELVDIVSFREVMKEHSDDYDIAFVEGSINRPGDAERLKEIRSNAKILIALGDCATTGCVNKLRNEWPDSEALTEVYPGAKKQIKGNEFFDIFPAKAINEVVEVDFYIRGCPVRKEQVLYYIKRFTDMPPSKNKDLDFGIILRNMEIDNRSVIKYNPRKCILCRRCVHICQDVMGVDALGVVEKGSEAIISTPQDIGFDANGCIRCGQCISTCPVGALGNRSPVETLAMEVKKKKLSIALDSVALATFVEKHNTLRDMAPELAERYVIAGLRHIGFQKVFQYDYYLAQSEQMDEKSETPTLASWCRSAQNYFMERELNTLEVKPENSPWSLLLDEVSKSICLVSPCSAMKEVEDFNYVLTGANLLELFRQLECDLDFMDPEGAAYDGHTVDPGFRHPGVPAPGRNGFGIRRDLPEKLTQAKKERGSVHVYPCLAGCTNGGGTPPTIDEEVIQERITWLEELRGV